MTIAAIIESRPGVCMPGLAAQSVARKRLLIQILRLRACAELRSGFRLRTPAQLCLAHARNSVKFKFARPDHFSILRMQSIQTWIDGF